MIKSDCVFCNIVKGTAKSYKIWEDDLHLAFLSNRPNTNGFTVVIPKAHYPSYGFELDNEVLTKLIIASKAVAKILDSAFEDVGRTGLIMEGFGVDHVHTKLIPMHGTGSMKEWNPILSENTKFFDVYEGYLSSHDASLLSDSKMEAMATRILKSL